MYDVLLFSVSPRWGQTKCCTFCSGQLVGSLRNRNPNSPRVQAPRNPKIESSTGRHEIESSIRRLVSEHTCPQEPQHLEIDGSLRNPTPHNKNANAPLGLNAEGPFRRLVTEHISQVKMIAIILNSVKCLPCTPAPHTSMLRICLRPSVEGGAFQRN